MMKKIYFFAIVLFIGFSANAQLNNSWIDYSKTYYKFVMYKDTLSRIPQSTLAAAGLGAVNADHFQLWRNGEQVRLYTSVTNAPLGAADYIEFYGLRNDGAADKPLYKDPANQLSGKYSFVNDTAVYFLTVNSVGSNLRFTSASNTAPSTATPDAYYMNTVDTTFRIILNPGFYQSVGSNVYSSAYDDAEGFGGNVLNGANFNFRFVPLNVYPAGPANSVTVRANAAGNTFGSRNLEVKLNNIVVYNEPMPGFEHKKAVVPNLPLTHITGTSTSNLILSINGALNASPNDRILVNSASVTYPATYNFFNRRAHKFELGPSPSGHYLTITNFAYNGVQPVLYDETSGVRYLGEITSTPGTVKFVLPAHTDTKMMRLLAADASSVNTVSTITQKQFVNLTDPAQQGTYLIVSHRLLYNDGNGNNFVNDYKNYRSSVNGGSYNAKVYDIDELTDQFAFGIKGHPASVRDFIRYADREFATQPQYVLLLGRGINYVDNYNFRANPLKDPQNLIPTFGNPASDILLASEPGLTYPLIPIGRIAAVTPTELNNYLQKVIQYEAAQRVSSPYIADKAWMKDGMHVVGGRDLTESSQFLGYMNAYKHIIEDTLYGGRIETFTKSSSGTIQQANSQRIQQLFNQGIGFIGYFGHSSANVLEFNLSDPNEYNNVGKYPFFNVSGCSAGNFYYFDADRIAGQKTISENYVLANQRGSIGFLADTHLGIPLFLHPYNVHLYNQFSKTNYANTLGNQIKEVIRIMGGQNPSLNYFDRMHLEEINLHGDPAIRLNTFAKPDYAIEASLVKIEPLIVSVADANFKVKVGMHNIGKATSDSIWVSVKRKLPNDSIRVLYDQKIPGIVNKDSLEFQVPINAITDKGINKIIVDLDYQNQVDELFETNNKIEKEFTIVEDELRPSFPANFSIINQQNITFSASSANVLGSGNRNHFMEIDTTELFNSPFKKSYTVSGPSGIVQFTPTNLTFTDSTVYYWRVAIEPTAGNNIIWNGFSFVYLPNSSDGVNQSHYYQFTKSSYDQNIYLNEVNRKLEFTNVNTELQVSTGNYPPWDFPNVQINLGAFQISNWGNVFNTLQFVLLNPISGNAIKNEPVSPTQGSYGSNYPGGNRVNQFEFPFATRAQRNVVRNFIENNVSPATTIMLYNLLNNGSVNSYVADWQADAALNGDGTSLYNTLRNYGFTEIDSFKSNRPFFAKFSKDGLSPLVQKVGDSATELIQLTVPMNISEIAGTVSSPVFGPSSEWRDFRWRGYPLEANGKDSIRFNIIGINNAGTETLLYSIDSTVHDFDISSIDAASYPYLKLQMFAYDSIKGTPYQLRYWRLNYEPVAEGAIATNILYQMADTVDQGEPIDLKIAFKNISEKAFDSLLKVKVTITDRNNNDHVYYVPPRKALVPGDTLTIHFTVNSDIFPGNNRIAVEVNPDHHQREQYHYNNFFFNEFFVREDDFNPLLDVTFDGVHILNNDIVASTPHILIKLKDESQFLELADTALLTVKVRFPDQSIRNYHFGDSMVFIPADLSTGENTASIEFKPFFAEDGEYELIVSGKDVNGNKAGDLDYHIGFNVINKPMISNLLNYPNPFTTSTAFVFTVTGSQPPQNMRIQILTITGKVVREITMNELGPIHVGRNITEFKWDGTDSYGQKLANGVYLYRVLTNLNGKSLDKYRADGDQTDKYFNKGYGKMYLMR